MLLTFAIAPRRFETAHIVHELPEVGAPFYCSTFNAAEVKALEPFPYPVPQDRQENYLYSVWRVLYRPANLPDDESAFVAIHEPEAERI